MNKEINEAANKYVESKELVLMAYSPEYIEDVKKDMEIAFKAGANWMSENIWRKKSDIPENKHPYPVVNLDTGELAFGFYDKVYGWQFDRDYNESENMLWLDIEKMPPIKRLIDGMAS